MSTSPNTADDTTKTTSSDVGETEAPDGGWGWVMVVSSHVTHLLTLGTFLSLSVMFVDWLDEFEAGRGMTSWVISVAIALLHVIGPVPAQLVALFGYKKVVIVGGLLTASGYLLSCFSTNVYMLILGIGIVAGCGAGLCYLPAIITVAPWFNKRRSLAMGLGSSGVGIGSFVCSPIIAWLIQQYGWRGTLMVIGGVQLHLSMFGLLLRVPSSGGANSSHKDTTLPGKDNGADAEPDLVRESKNQMPGEVSPIPAVERHISGSFHHLESAAEKPSPRLFSSSHELSPRTNYVQKRAGTDALDPANVDILMCGSLHSLPLINRHTLHYDGSKNSLHCSKRDMQSASLLENGDNTHSLHLLTKDDPPDKEVIVERVKADDSESYPELQALDRWKLLQDPYFVLLILSNFLTNLAYVSPVLYIVDRARDNGIAQTSASILVSIVGAGNVFGRIALPVLLDWLLSDRIVGYILILSVCGVVTTLSTLCGSSLILHAVYAFIFGATIGCSIAMLAVVTVDLVGIHLLNYAYGFLIMFIGVACLVGPPLAGWIFDETGDYQTSYLLNGLFVLASSLILVPVAVQRRKRARKLSNFL